MKKNILKVAFVAAIAMATGIQVFNAQKTETLSEVAMSNVEALAADEDNGSCTKVCYECNGWICTRIYDGETSRCIHHRKL